MAVRIKAQSTIEYALLIAAVVAALVSMQIYMKRSKEGQLRDAVDGIGSQFEANNTSINYERRRTVTSVEEVSGGQTIIYTGDSGKGAAEVITKNSSENVDPWP